MEKLVLVYVHLKHVSSLIDESVIEQHLDTEIASIEIFKTN